MKFEIEFPGSDKPYKLFEKPIIDLLSSPGDIGLGINWTSKTIHWAGSFDLKIENHPVPSSPPSRLVITNEYSWHNGLHRLNLAEFAFAASWVLNLEELSHHIEYGIGFPISVFNSTARNIWNPDDINCWTDVIVLLGTLRREGGYLQWQMERELRHNLIVHRV